MVTGGACDHQGGLASVSCQSGPSFTAIPVPFRAKPLSAWMACLAFSLRRMRADGQRHHRWGRSEVICQCSVLSAVCSSFAPWLSPALRTAVSPGQPEAWRVQADTRRWRLADSGLKDLVFPARHHDRDRDRRRRALRQLLLERAGRTFAFRQSRRFGIPLPRKARGGLRIAHRQGAAKPASPSLTSAGLQDLDSPAIPARPCWAVDY